MCHTCLHSMYIHTYVPHLSTQYVHTYVPHLSAQYVHTYVPHLSAQYVHTYVPHLSAQDQEGGIERAEEEKTAEKATKVAGTVYFIYVRIFGNDSFLCRLCLLLLLFTPQEAEQVREKGKHKWQAFINKVNWLYTCIINFLWM